jgi:hypothetical protein
MGIYISTKSCHPGNKPRYVVNDVVYVINRDENMESAVIKSVHPVGFVYGLDKQIQIGKTWYIGESGYCAEDWQYTLAPEEFLHSAGDDIRLTSGIIKQIFKNETDT